MDFGVVLQTNPPAWRTVQLAELAEAHGFDYVWTFDSHLLWQEPYVIYSKILAETHRIKVGPFVTNPATRDWTVTASIFATLNEMYGNRTICGIGRGDSAVRVTNGKRTTLKELRESIHVIRELANSRPVEYHGSQLQFPWSRGSELEVWVAAYGPLALKLAGESIGGRPLLLLAFFCVLGGLQFLTTGVIAELLIRIYFEGGHAQPYRQLAAAPVDEASWSQPRP